METVVVVHFAVFAVAFSAVAIAAAPLSIPLSMLLMALEFSFGVGVSADFPDKEAVVIEAEQPAVSIQEAKDILAAANLEDTSFVDRDSLMDHWTPSTP